MSPGGWGRSPLGPAVVSDALVTGVCFLVAVRVRFPDLAWSDPLMAQHVALVPGILVVWYLCLASRGAYRREVVRDRLVLAQRVIQAVVVAHLALVVLLFYTKTRFLSRAVVAAFAVADVALIMVGRDLMQAFLRPRERPRALICGNGPLGARLAAALDQEEGIEVVGWLRSSVAGAGVDGLPELGELGELRAVVEQHGPIDEVVVVVPECAPAEVAALVEDCERRGLSVREVLVPVSHPGRRAEIERLAGVYLLSARESPAAPSELFVKRLIDLVGGMVGSLITLALTPLIGLAIRLESAGPIFFAQERVGLNRRPIWIYKFRSMVPDADQQQEALRDALGVETPHFHVAHDPRVTRVGRFLRRTSLDEFPQFFNVLRGELSLVGPRPLSRADFDRLDWGAHRRVSVRPGLTGIWQTSGRKRIKDFDQVVAMDDEYIRSWSLWLDLRLILKTIPVLLLGDDGEVSEQRREAHAGETASDVSGPETGSEGGRQTG